MFGVAANGFASPWISNRLAPRRQGRARRDSFGDDEAMIRFICQHCQKSVQVADAFAGKQGRCPFCKDLVPIPLRDDPTARADGPAGQIEAPATDDLRALKAAVLNEPPSQPAKAVPPPPQSAEQTDEIQIDLSGRRGGSPADTPEALPPQPTLVQPETPARAPRLTRRFASRSRFNLGWIVFAIGLIVILMILAFIFLIGRHD